MHYNIDAIILCNWLRNQYHLDINKIMPPEDNFAGSLMFAYLIICFNDGQAKCSMEKIQIIR